MWHGLPDPIGRHRIEQGMQANEQGHDARTAQHLEPGRQCLVHERRVVDAASDRARVPVGRGGIQPAARNAADQQRQQQRPAAIRDVQCAGTPAFLDGGHRRISRQVVEVVPSLAQHGLPFGCVDVEQPGRQRRGRSRDRRRRPWSLRDVQEHDELAAVLARVLVPKRFVQPARADVLGVHAQTDRAGTLPASLGTQAIHHRAAVAAPLGARPHGDAE